ncbi:undecaprenyl-phosphate glucose phosphotransferase [Hyphomicrobium sp.]|uniref:undecaprenyl-phosphate glucose phosphotransferase n=1 Tax=Hyphomicrobium sp. TaxID=82 RepID=UPI002E333810|nr:undecaprenyl-phosphate glucose phosphotransferase [Hyphomicrobium sp.]HEX2841488.1 undecaprenyl-phosphate glucose phosphotransferase [Hyphomicrobium sp.]
MAILSHESPDDVSIKTTSGSVFSRALAFAGNFVDRAFSDKRRSISRPKLLFATCALDAIVLIATGAVAYSLFDHAHATLPGIAVWTFMIAIATTLELRRNWSYSTQALRRPAEQFGKVVKSAAAVFCIAAGAGYLIGMPPFTPLAGIAWFASAVLLITAARFGLAKILEDLTEAGRLVRRTVIVGGGPDAEHLIKTLESDNRKELAILGVFDDRSDERSADSVSGYPKLGNFEQLPAFSRNAGVDLIIVTVPMSAENRLMQILQILFTLPVDIRISALSSKLRLSSGAYSYIGRVPMLALMDRPLTDWDRVIKNIEDRVLGTLLFLLAAPVMALVALAIRLDSKGPILFKQRRYGFNNELIEVLKFRSMYTDMADASASKLVTKDDPRVTPVGRFIRKTSLDELPQLLNVIKGEMSLVGPRPHATEAKASSDLYQTVVGEYFARHRMKPGVTGWAQINGWRGETDTHEKIHRRVEADLYYIDNWSLLFDLYIIAATPFALLTGKNAY